MFKDRVYLKRLLTLAIPIIIQEGIFASLNLVDFIMIGQLGETAIASVGLGGQLFFLLAFFLFGIGSGSSVFTAQYWGKRDINGIHKVLGMGLMLGAAGAFFFTIAAIFFPQNALMIYTSDPAVINTGKSYLTIVGFSYLATAITFSYSFVLRSVENTRLPMIVGVGALTLKTILNYLLIFGSLGFPVMGINGAALATTIARILECIVLLFLTYRLKTPAAAALRQMVMIDKNLFKQFIYRALPVVFNEMLWSLGISSYYAIYARIGTNAVASINVTSTIENLSFVIFIGVCDATAIMVGNRIGAGEKDKAFSYALRTLFLGAAGALFIGLLILAFKSNILTIYNITESSRQNINILLTIFAFTMWIKVSAMNLFVGVFRSGGDTRFALVVDAGAIWLIGVPLALLGAFVLHLAVYWVYLLVVAEEFIKLLIALTRFISRKWINDVTVAA